MNRTIIAPRQAAFLLCLVFTLTACAIVSPGISDSTPTPTTASVIPTVETVFTPTEAVPTPTPTPTLAPVVIGFVGRIRAAPPGSIVALSLEGAQAAAAAHSAQLDIVDIDAPGSADPSAAIRMAVERSPVIVIVAGSDLAEATRAAAREYADMKFVGVDQPAVDSLANYFTLGDPGNRPDEEGFIAGTLAGLVTRERKVGVLLIGGTLEGRLYKNGFLHGMRYTCGDCELTAIELSDPDDTAAGERAATQMKNMQVDVMFAAAGVAGDSGVAAGAAQGLWVIGLGRDHAQTVPIGAEFVLASIVRRPDLSLPGLIDSLLVQGTAPSIPFALANSNVSYAETFCSEVSPGILTILSETLAVLTEGSLDTGIDRTTGEEQ